MPVFEPLTVIGDRKGWADFEVSCDVYLEQPGHVALFGHCQELALDSVGGYCLKVDHKGHWGVLVLAGKEAAKTLAEGTVTFGVGSWHTLALKFSGPRIVAHVDGVEIAAVEDRTYSTGPVGLGTGWNTALFDNFSITAKENPARPVKPER
jgi:hypothetical protein